MGRARTKNLGLPPNLYVKRDGYYIRFPDKSEKKVAGKGDAPLAISEYNRLIGEGMFKEGGNALLMGNRAAWKAVPAAESFSALPPWAIALYKNAKKNAKQRKIGFLLTEQDFLVLAKRSQGCCEVSGIPFDFYSHVKSARGIVRKPFYPSLDRVESSQCYFLENCRLVSTAVNYALSCWGESTLVFISRHIVQRNGYSISK